MSGVTDAQRKALIIAQVGDENGIIAANIDVLWTLYTWAADVDYLLRDAYVKRECIKLVMGQVRGLVDTRISGDSDVSAHQKFTSLKDMLKECESSIDQLGKSLKTGVVAMGQLTTVAPDSPPTGSEVNANDSAYGGDPYYATRIRQRY